ncbi:hypothetical protein [Owenweeksia hongkongensis]|uniref:hypothetical protein n=1 Tax=Owenweeksia hongkongensis TaxID=253245 RepID=UPI003A8CF14C
MKVMQILGFLVVLGLGASCNKAELKESEPHYPADPVFTVSFVLVDAAGNSLLPHLNFDPSDFRASSNNNDSIGYNLGTVLFMRESFDDIISDPSYSQDSMFVFYPCFNADCDTVFIKKTDFFSKSDSVQGKGCSADQVIWGLDTIFEYRCTKLEIHKTL